MRTTYVPRFDIALPLAAIAALALAALSGCAGAPRSAPETRAAVPKAGSQATTEPFHEFFRALPSIGLTSGSSDGKLVSPVSGNVVALEGVFDDPRALGNAVCVRTSVEYSIDGATRTDSFLVVLGGLESASAEPGPLKSGEELGLAPGREIYCAIAADFPSPYLVVMSPRAAFRADGRWWFDPSFLFSSGTTSWLSFDPIPSFDAAVKEVGDHVSSEPPGMALYTDERYRFATSLTERPSPLSEEDSGRIAVFERMLYGRTGIYKLGQRVKAGGYEVLLCWQGGFDRYLADEYEPGDRIWLYGNLVTYDVWAKTAYFFIRDFSLESVERMYARKAPPADA